MINGTYKFYLDGNEVATSKNLITSSGKTTIKQYLVGNISAWCSAMAVGSMSTAATVDDTKLGFEVDRASVITQTVDGLGNILLRAQFPLDLKMRIDEVGLYPFINTTATGKYQDAIISDFSESTWQNGNTDSTTSYVGTSNILLNSSHPTATLNGLNIDLSGYSQTDRFELLVNNLDSHSKTLTLAISDGITTQTYEFPTLSASAGLKSVSVAMENIVIQNISSITIESTGSHRSVSLDCLKFLNTDESGYSMSLVSRSVLGSTIVKEAGQDLEVEYLLAGL